MVSEVEFEGIYTALNTQSTLSQAYGYPGPFQYEVWIWLLASAISATNPLRVCSDLYPRAETAESWLARICSWSRRFGEGLAMIAKASLARNFAALRLTLSVVRGFGAEMVNVVPLVNICLANC